VSIFREVGCVRQGNPDRRSTYLGVPILDKVAMTERPAQLHLHRLRARAPHCSYP
jgi:hypothetical protein